jgi:hypothetical protein
MKTTVVVKGNREQAERSAKAHKVPFVFVREYKHHGWLLWTIGEVEAGHERELRSWFYEKDGLKPDFGFVPGVLISVSRDRS